MGIKLGVCYHTTGAYETQVTQRWEETVHSALKFYKKST